MTVELPAYQLEQLADMIVSRLMNTAPNMGLIQALGSTDLEAALDAREREIRAKRRRKQ